MKPMEPLRTAVLMKTDIVEYPRPGFARCWQPTYRHFKLNIAHSWRVMQSIIAVESLTPLGTASG